MSEHYPQRPFQPPPDATEVILLRHGASAAAKPGEPFALVDGHSDPPLAPEGREQAQAAARRLTTVRALKAIFVTPLRRTHETAAPLAAATGLEPVVVPELREVHLGEWEGGEFRIRAAERDPLIARIFAEQRWDVIPGAEAMDALAERVASGFDRVVEQIGPGGTGVAVLHAGVIGEICRQVTGARSLAFIHSDNASISRVVVFADGRRLLRTFNDISHLAAPEPQVA